MRARLLLILAVVVGVAPSFEARADVSPEYYQLLSDINGSLKVLGPSLTRGPVCAPDMVEMARQGLQGNLFSTAATKVVVEPLETGAKVAAGALGVESLAITTYSLVRCGMSEDSPEGFAKCALGEGLGFAGGEALTAAGVGNLSGAVAGAAWDKAYGAMRGAIEDYDRQSETLEWTARGTCEVKVLAHWNKHARPGAEGGKITISARTENCKCATGNSLRQGSLRFSVPVHYDRAGASQPGWRAGTPGEYMLEAQCCAEQRADGRVHLYDPAGRLRAPATSVGNPRQSGDRSTAPPPRGDPATSTTPSPGASISRPPPPAAALWSVENPCPACEPFKTLMDEHVRAATDADRQAAQLRQEIAHNLTQQNVVRLRIAALEHQLGSREGAGASAHDPETGLTTESTTQADGSVLITVKDSNGNEIERRARDPRDSAQLRVKIAREQEALSSLQQVATERQQELDRQQRLAAKHRRLAQDALSALKHCLIEQCGQGSDRIMSMTVPGLSQLPPDAVAQGPALSSAPMPSAVAPVQCSFPAAQPIVIGPKADFGNSEEKKAVEAGKAVLGLIGGLLGDGGGGDDGGSPFGMMPGGGDSGPALVSNPVADMQRFALPDTGTAIQAGARFREDGKLLMSVEVDESPDDGVVHQIELQRLVPNADGGCALQVMRPGQWLHYRIYEKWWAKLRIQTFVNDGGGWQKTGDSGWMDWESGTNVLDTGRIAASEIPNTGWGSMGADRAMGGPRAAGALFDPGKPARYEKPVPERFVVHVSKPESDPVTTVPFTFYPLYWSDGTVALTDRAPAEPFGFTGPPPKLPVGGGMTQIDPPNTPPREDILNEIDYVPIRQ